MREALLDILRCPRCKNSSFELEGRQSWRFEKGRLYTNDTMFYIIRGFCERNNINLIETHEDLRKIKEHPLYYKYDGHFTKLGNKAVSEIIYEKLLPILMQDTE